MLIREADTDDLDGLMRLYTHLNNDPLPEYTEDVLTLWHKIIADTDHHIITAIEDEMIVSSCVCVIIPNLTHQQRSYALIENVVTHTDYRGRGFATACLDYAKCLAEQAGCYKLMLLTGSKKESTLSFYERAGYNRKDKTAFIQWI